MAIAKIEFPFKIVNVRRDRLNFKPGNGNIITNKRMRWFIDTYSLN